MDLVRIAKDLVKELRPLRFGAPITHVYNPLEYAWAPHLAYLERFGRGPREVVLLGMNPGPWGMAQTGVPFGEVALVRDWLGIEAEVLHPEPEHPKRPIEGFGCTRSEVSGARLWGWVRDSFGSPQRFFQRFFIANYCPLVFMEESGKNFTPDKLKESERGPLLEVCDRALSRLADAMQPQWLIGVGAFAEARAAAALEGRAVKIGRVLHPSPASPLANKDWGGAATQTFTDLGIRLR